MVKLWSPTVSDEQAKEIVKDIEARARIEALCDHKYTPDDMQLHNAPGFNFSVGDLRKLLAQLRRYEKEE